MNTLEISNIAAACGKNPYEDKKKILLLGYKNFSEITYYDQLKHFVHLEGVDKLSNVTICRNLNHLEINLTLKIA